MQLLSKPSLIAGVLNGLGAGMLWGLVFVVPRFLTAFTPVEITLGRFGAYGLLSLGLLLRQVLRHKTGRYSPKIWRMALLLGLTGNLGYYYCVVQGIQWAGAPITILTIGALPVTIAVAGNLLQRQYQFAKLLPPLGLIAIGLLTVNLPVLMLASSQTLGQQLLGLGFALSALGCWTFYGVANARFLQRHPQISAGDWSNLLGVSTLLLCVLMLPLLHWTSPTAVNWSHFATWNRTLIAYLVGSLILGLVVSWGSTLLWNRASTLLPVALTGQLIVFETIFGLLYVFILERRWPSGYELLGGLLLLSGVWRGVRLAASAKVT